MGFNFRAIFTGLCAFVPDQPIDATAPPKTKPTKMTTVMVDARTAKTAQDGNPLMPHFPIAVINSQYLQNNGGIPGGTRIEWLLDRRELTFEVAGGTPATFDLVAGALVGGMPQTNEDFGWGAQIESAAPDFSQIDPRCFQDAGSAGLVVTRVVLDKGRLTSYGMNPPNSVLYFFDDTLKAGGFKAARPLSNKVALELDQVTAVALVARDLDGARPTQRLALSPDANGMVEITIANLCDGQIPERTPNLPVDPKNDEDFRWFYQLCAQRASLAGALAAGASLPIPRVLPHTGGPGAVQCMRATFAPYPKV